jgi:hypothetical protein
MDRNLTTTDDTAFNLIHDTIRQAHAAHETDADTLAHRVTDNLRTFGHLPTEKD